MSNRTVVRDQILEWQNRIDHAVRGIDAHTLETEPAVGEWPPNVVVAHLADWLELGLANSRAAVGMESISTTIDIEDDFNDRAAETAGKQSWAKNSHRLHNQVELTGGFLSDIDDVQWETVVAYPWGGEGTIKVLFEGLLDHHQEHGQELHDWREARSG